MATEAQRERRRRKRKKKQRNPDTLGPLPDHIRFRKRDLKKQIDRDAFGDSLAGDMARAAEREDWAEYNRIKEILYRTT